MKHMVYILISIFLVLVAFISTHFGVQLLKKALELWYLFIPIVLLIIWFLLKPKKRPQPPLKHDIDFTQNPDQNGDNKESKFIDLKDYDEKVSE